MAEPKDPNARGAKRRSRPEPPPALDASDVTTLPPTAPAETIEGPKRDFLLEGGRKPKVDVSREYISGGARDFPLVGQLELSRGSDDLARDLGLDVYEAMLCDSTIWSALHVLITGILSGQWQMTPALKSNDGEPVEEGSDREFDIQVAKDVATFCQRSIDRLGTPIKQVCYDLLLGMAYGCRLAEKVYERGLDEDADRIVLKLLRVKRNKSWSFVVAPTGDIVGIRALCFDVGIHDLPPQKFLIATWMQRDGDPRGRSILRPAYNPWNLKLNGWPKYYAYLDLFGCPLPVGIAAPDAPNEPDVDARGNEIPGSSLTPTEAMARMLSRLKGGGSYAALRSGSSIQFAQAVGNGEAFSNFFRFCKQEILEAILMSARPVMEAERNSKADAETSRDVVGQIITYGREWLEEVLRSQVLYQLVELNWGRRFADKFTPRQSLGPLEQSDITSAAASYAAIGYVAEEEQFAAIDARLGLPVRTSTTRPLDDDEEIDQDPEGDQGVDQEGNPVGFNRRRSRPRRRRRTVRG